MLNGISAVTTGQIHINQGRECEDYTELDLERKDYVMTAVADGHSSQKHFRSDRGSQFAAEAANQGLEIVSAEAFTADSKTDFTVQLQKAKYL